MDVTIGMRLLLTVIFMSAILLAIWLPAQAHSPEHFAQMGADNEQWMRGLKNEKGGLCCSGNDGFDAVYDTQGNSYRVLLYGSYWIVPDEAVIKEPNKMGVAQVWYSTQWSTAGVPTPQIRCFIPAGGV